MALTEEDQMEIYAAVARQLYTVDHTFGDPPPNWPSLYIITLTEGMDGPRIPLSEAIISGMGERLSDLPNQDHLG